MKRLLAAALIALYFVVPATAAQLPSEAAICSTSVFKPDQFEVAIDRASGITFVQTPCGWSYIGIVAPESIAEGIQMSNAKPVPAKVLAAELTLQPWLANYRAKIARR
jgi:hypothetical protein